MQKSKGKSETVQGNLLKLDGAKFSKCRKYRYALWRVWDDRLPLVMFVGLNPSTANETKADNTITKVCAIANTNGFGGLYMMNLFPLVSTDPAALNKFYDTPLHDHQDILNLRCLFFVKRKCKEVVFAWGNFKVAEKRAKLVAEYFKGAACLAMNKNGSPKHPLYCRNDQRLIPFTIDH